MTNDMIVSCSINYTRIPKTNIKKATNGKLYFTAEIRTRKEPDEFGNDLNVMLPKLKKEDERIYIGNGRLFCFKDAKKEDFEGYISASICLSDIDKSKLIRSGNNLYFNIEITKRKEPDQYGNDLSVRIRRTKEETEKNIEVRYCGNGKIVLPAYQDARESDLADFDLNNFVDIKDTLPDPRPFTPEIECDDLPF